MVTDSKKSTRKRVQNHRKRRKHGILSLKDQYVLEQDLPQVQPHLLSAEEVQKIIEEREKRDEV